MTVALHLAAVAVSCAIVAIVGAVAVWQSTKADK